MRAPSLQQLARKVRHGGRECAAHAAAGRRNGLPHGAPAAVAPFEPLASLYKNDEVASAASRTSEQAGLLLSPVPGTGVKNAPRSYILLTRPCRPPPRSAAASAPPHLVPRGEQRHPALAVVAHAFLSALVVKLMMKKCRRECFARGQIIMRNLMTKSRPIVQNAFPEAIPIPSLSLALAPI